MRFISGSFLSNCMELEKNFRIYCSTFWNKVVEISTSFSNGSGVVARVRLPIVDKMEVKKSHGPSIFIQL